MKKPNGPARRKQWTHEQMTAAMEACRNRSSPFITKQPEILQSHPPYWISGCVLHGSKPGPTSYLSEEEESSWKNISLNAPVL